MRGKCNDLKIKNAHFLDVRFFEYVIFENYEPASTVQLPPAAFGSGLMVKTGTLE